ncbi:uncharacterized protein LOC144135254 [Amblyomma americanum]
MCLRLLAHLRLVVSCQRQSPFRILADHRMPALIAFESAIYVGPEFVMYFCLPALRRAGNVGPFAAWLLMKLCYTTWMVASSKVNGPLLVSGFKMMRDRAVMASTFYAHNSYSKYLVCRPRTLPDLYGSRTSALPEICHEPSGLSREDILKACACLYEMLASSEHGELIQMHHDKYGAYMENFVLDNALGACVWVFALCNALWTAVSMVKMLLGDMVALTILYLSYTRQRRRGSTRRGAFHAALLALLTTGKPLPDVVPYHQVAEAAEVQEQEVAAATTTHTTMVNRTLTRGVGAS